jgi:hypothetical protein
MSIPLDAVLQYSTPAGDISHNGILASNINSTPIQQSFPVTNTGISLGQYNHLGIDGQGNNKTDYLNMSGTSTGGYNFWTSNSTDAPILLADITTDGISIAASGISCIKILVLYGII